ncbi:hypothetical protein [Moorena sp. SIO3B2]|uniref:hypothetical protein n=1 Tax=Moorena sp. SIO3B2 TaxID=2607827 RepID=UPI0013CDB7CE|nr:hypothetical protein [Moorena sp. SIO3B2]NEP34041.1 hypothetical protein [Moorena sp. SIO3B2]
MLINKNTGVIQLGKKFWVFREQGAGSREQGAGKSEEGKQSCVADSYANRRSC